MSFLHPWATARALAAQLKVANRIIDRQQRLIDSWVESCEAKQREIEDLTARCERIRDGRDRMLARLQYLNDDESPLTVAGFEQPRARVGFGFEMADHGA